MLREFYVLNGVISLTFQAVYLGHRQSACGNLHIDKGIDYITITAAKSKLLWHLNMLLKTLFSSLFKIYTQDISRNLSSVIRGTGKCL